MPARRRDRGSGLPVGRLQRLYQQVELPRPAYERLCCLLALHLVVRPLDLVQHLVASVDARTNLVLPQQGNRVRQRPNDVSITHAQLGDDEHLGRGFHGLLNRPVARWFRGTRQSCNACFESRRATFMRCTLSPARWVQMMPSRTSLSARGSMRPASAWSSKLSSVTS